jgi:hypothetical protein
MAKTDGYENAGTSLSSARVQTKADGSATAWLQQ